MNLLSENFKYLREKSGKSQAAISLELSFSRGAWNNYETGKSKPSIDDLIKISKYFGYNAGDLLEIDLSKVEPTKNNKTKKNTNNIEANPKANVEVKGKKRYEMNDIQITVVAESEYKMVPIPITDISVAAGDGHYNADYISNVESIRLPINLVKKNQTYLCVKIKGASMAPTLQDGGYVVIRLLDRGDWAKMPDERIYVVSDNDGKSYLKRVKNRFNQGLIILRSDSPDQVNYPNFNLTNDEINTIWIVEWYLSAKLPNIHDQYYSRLQRLEDKLDNLIISNKKIQR